MLARTADCLFWMSRYVERAENIARFIDVNQTLSLGSTIGEVDQWSPLIHSSGDEETFLKRYSGRFERADVLKFLTIDMENPNSIVSCLCLARENARTIRADLSTPIWEELNIVHQWLRRKARDPGVLVSPDEFLQRVRKACQLITGVVDTTILHDAGWEFCRVGRLIERADKTSRILDTKYYRIVRKQDAAMLETVQWSALLGSTSALEMYRREHGKLDPANVVEFLLRSIRFPRSVGYCLHEADESLDRLCEYAPGRFDTVSAELHRLRETVDGKSANQIIIDGLHEFIDGLQTGLNRVGIALHEALEDVSTLASEQQASVAEPAEPSQSQSQG